MTSRQSCEGEVADAAGAGLAGDAEVPAPVLPAFPVPAVVAVVAVGVAVGSAVVAVVVPDTVASSTALVSNACRLPF
ncbi:hypothetical protein, partial [Streptomyces shenzhenensis]|uniref:hypothetical protein n=1 Tax=Streptomyces shenzhenensis TaxID=943815 RepID=UPI001C690807